MVTLDWRTKGQKILPIGDNYHVCVCLKIFKLYFSIISFYKELIIWMIEGWYEWMNKGISGKVSNNILKLTFWENLGQIVIDFFMKKICLKLNKS